MKSSSKKGGVQTRGQLRDPMRKLTSQVKLEPAEATSPISGEEMEGQVSGQVKDRRRALSKRVQGQVNDQMRKLRWQVKLKSTEEALIQIYGSGVVSDQIVEQEFQKSPGKVKLGSVEADAYQIPAAKVSLQQEPYMFGSCSQMRKPAGELSVRARGNPVPVPISVLFQYLFSQIEHRVPVPVMSKKLKKGGK